MIGENKNTINASTRRDKKSRMSELKQSTLLILNKSILIQENNQHDEDNPSTNYPL